MPVALYPRYSEARFVEALEDAAKTLTLGARSGSYPGMLASRTIQIVLVSASKPVGFSFTSQVDKALTYTGETISAKW